MKFCLLTPSLNQVLRLAILNNILRRRKEKRINNNNNNPQPKSKHKLQHVVDFQTWVTPQGWNTNIHFFVSPAKGVKKVRLSTSTKTAYHCLR